MQLGKRYDDYLPSETRAQYVERRQTQKLVAVRFYWPARNGTFAGQTTQEYKRFKKNRQIGQIKRIDTMFKDATKKGAGLR